MLEGAGRDLDVALWAETMWKKGCQHARQTPRLPGWTNVDECCCCCCCDYYYVFRYCAACMKVHALCLWKPEDGVRFPGTGVTDGLEPSGRDAGNPT